MDLQLLIPVATSIIAAITTLTSLIFGAKLQKANELNVKLKDSLSEKKVAFYQDLFSFFNDAIDGKYDRDDDNYADLINFMQQKFKEAAYYASPEVLKSLGDLMQHVYTSEDADVYALKSRKLFAEMTVQIRKDLGHDTSRFRQETWLDIMRFTIRDIHDYIPSGKAHDRGRKTRPDMIHEGKKII